MCQCECGNQKEIASSNLKKGATLSCGCLHSEIISMLNFKDLTGQIFGKLVVVERVKEIKSNGVMWKCKCECGNEIVVSGNHLRSGHTKSCGCLKSAGEEKINKILSESGINYSAQYTVFINSSYMRFDYAIFDNANKLLRFIEFDGE